MATKYSDTVGQGSSSGLDSIEPSSSSSNTAAEGPRRRSVADAGDASKKAARVSVARVDSDNADSKPRDVENDADRVQPIADFEMGEEVSKEDSLHRPADAGDVLTHSIHVTDDPSLPAITFRSIFLGVCLSVFGGVLSGIYYFKPQQIVLSPVFLAVVSFLLGEAMSLGIPRKGKIGRFLNPHQFNIKEHLTITIMANSASISALGIEVIAAERLFYGKQLSPAISIFLLLSSQFLGYGITGLMRRTMVFPKAMLWPANIPVNSMLETLHKRAPENSKRLKVFLIFFAAIFCWEVVPEYIMPILTGVSVFCLAKQNSQVFTYVFGGTNGDEGLGLFSLCFDWQYISGGFSPLYYPIESLVSQGIGCCVCIVMFCAVFWNNAWGAQKFAFLGQVIFSDTSSGPGNYVQYDQTAVIGSDNRVDPAAVAKYGLPNFSSSNVLNLMFCNMSTAACFVHMLLWYPREMAPAVRFLDPRNLLKIREFPSWIRGKIQRSTEPEPMRDIYDPHYALSLAYKAVPDWWFAIILAVAFVVAMVVLHFAHSTLPWWGFIVAMILGWFMIVVLGSMQAVSGVWFQNQSVVQMIGGYLHPGNPVSNMYFSLYGYNSLLQGILLAQDLKLAQYGHLAPRVTFSVQMAGTIIGALLNYVMANSIIKNQYTILKSIEGSNIWSGQQAQQFNGQAVSFGGFAHELFSVGGKYEWVSFSTFIGFVVPLPLYFAHKKYPNFGFNMINTGVIMYFAVYLNVGINSSVMSYFLIGFFAQWWLRRKYPNVFVKYNYLVSAALDGGTSVIVFIMSFALFGAAGKAVNFPQYWGNNAQGNFDLCMSVDQQ